MYQAVSTSEGLIGLLRKLSTHNQPWQIAAAIVLGCACGLLPKTNLLFPLALAILFVLPVHLPVAAVVMLASSLAAPMIQPLQGLVGTWLFQFDLIARILLRLDQSFLLPWLRLNNTVVAGSVGISSVLAIPVYVLVHRFLLIEHTHWLANRSRLIFEHDLLTKRQTAFSSHLDSSNPIDRWAQTRPATVEPDVEPKPLAAHHRSAFDHAEVPTSQSYIRDRQSVAHLKKSPTIHSKENLVDSIHALETLLDSTGLERQDGLDSESILRRATRAAELVDSIVHGLEADLIQRVDTDHCVETFKAHETTISISRLTDTFKAEGKLDNCFQNSNSFLPIKESMIFASHSPVITPPVPKQKLGTIRENDSVSQAHETATRNVEIRHEEALRHLLTHLRSIKDEVRQA